LHETDNRKHDGHLDEDTHNGGECGAGLETEQDNRSRNTLKALSPAIDDPTTSVLSIDQLHRMLRMVGKRRLRGQFRALFRTPNWEDFVHLAFAEIRAVDQTICRLCAACGQ
jgi:hypothetical protein